MVSAVEHVLQHVLWEANTNFVWKESLFTVEKESGYEKLHLHSISRMT